MEFEWDDAKNAANVRKHGIDFDMARQIFDGFTLDKIDERFEYGEERIISIGQIAGIIALVVVHTDRDGRCRIISARQAKKQERIRYEKALREAT